MEEVWIGEVYGHIYQVDTRKFHAEYTIMYPDTARAEDGEVVKLRAVVKSLTSGLRRRPFRPWRWRERAKALLKLGWPELAVGDAYKALLLVQAISIDTWKHAEAVRREIRREYPSTELITIIRSLTNDVKTTLCESLFFANSFVECIHFLKWSQWSRKIADLSRLAERAEADERKELEKERVGPDGVEEYMRSGRISWTDYPFTAGGRAHRSAETMAIFNACFERDSGGQCSIGKSIIGRGPSSTQVPRNAPNSMYGIFARKTLQAGSQILLSTTYFSGCSEIDRCYGCCDELPTPPVRLECCDKSFCSLSCAKSFTQIIHHEDYSCSKAFDNTEAHVKVFFRDLFGMRRRPGEPFRQEDEISETEMSQAKLLEKVLQAASKDYREYSLHPLESGLIKGLTNAKGARQAVKFSLEEDIVWPMNMLEQIGVDVFTTPDFDTWVIQTIKARLRANSWERTIDGVEIEAISLLFSFFNNSCLPNAKWEHVGGGTTLKITTLRPVAAGDEIYISYIGHEEVASLSKSDRKEKLAGWFENCYCSRCHSGEEDGGDQDLIRLGARIRRHLSVSVAPAPAPTVNDADLALDRQQRRRKFARRASNECASPRCAREEEKGKPETPRKRKMKSPAKTCHGVPQKQRTKLPSAPTRRAMPELDDYEDEDDIMDFVVPDDGFDEDFEDFEVTDASDVESACSTPLKRQRRR